MPFDLLQEYLNEISDEAEWASKDFLSELFDDWWDAFEQKVMGGGEG